MEFINLTLRPWNQSEHVKSGQGLVYKATEAIADPEAREVSEKCYLAINKLVEAGAFQEQDFKTFAEKHGISLGGLDEAQIDFCNQAAFQLVKAKKPKKPTRSIEYHCAKKMKRSFQNQY